MKIALVRPRCGYDEAELQEPLGAEAICGYLRQQGLECRVFDRRIGASAADLAAYGPDWVGFSLMTEDDVPDALQLLQLLKKEGRRFFAGGLFVTVCPERSRALFPRDTVLIPGEGEAPVFALVTGGNPETAGKLRPDDWAFASRDELGTYLQRGGVINLRTARGCRGCCAFCTTPGSGVHYEGRSVALVAEEMAALARSGYEPVFNFTDDEFGDWERIRSLEEELKARGMRAAFSMELRAQALIRTPASDWPGLYAGGLCRVFTGLESFDPETRSRWGKAVDVPALLETLAAMKQAGIVTETGYILWHGQTTPESAFRELELLHENGLLSPKAALSRMILYPGSRLYREAGLRSEAPAPLRPDAEALHDRWVWLLEPLFPLWKRAALAMPGVACRAQLAGDRSRLEALQGVLSRVSDLTWLSLTGGERIDPVLCRETGGDLDAICSPYS